MTHNYWKELFQIASDDDAGRLLEALKTASTLPQIRNEEGTSLVLFCVYRDRKHCLQALASRADEYTRVTVAQPMWAYGPA
jgi:hypothetical protein